MGYPHDFRNLHMIQDQDPYAPCMEYLPTFALNINQMWVNILYMKHMGDDCWVLDCQTEIQLGPTWVSFDQQLGRVTDATQATAVLTGFNLFSRMCLKLRCDLGAL